MSAAVARRPGAPRAGGWAVLALALVAGCGAPAAVDSGVPPRSPEPTAPAAPSPRTSAAPAATAGTAAAAPSGAGTPAPSGTSACDPELTYAPPAALPAPAAFPAGSRLARIRDRGRIVAGVTSDVLYFGARNPRTRTIEGFDIEMVRALSQAIFGSPDRIEFKVFAAAQRLPYLKDGTVDVVARTMTVTCDRWKDIDFSAIYLRGRSGLLVRRSSGWKGSDDALRAGARLCGSAGSTGVGETKRRRARLGVTTTIVEVEQLTDCMPLFLAERVDGLVSDDVLLAGLAAQDPLASVVVREPEDEVKPIALGLPKDPAFTAYVNGVLAAMQRDGRWRAAYDRWLPSLGVAGTPPVPHYGRRP